VTDMKLRIRTYRRGDRAAILEMTPRCFDGFCLDQNIEQQFGRIGGVSWQERKKSGIEYDLDSHPSDTLVAEVDGKVVGYACTRLYRLPSIGHVANLAVSPEFQGKGIGKALLHAALEHFKRHGMRHARIETLEQNYKGKRFYPSFGFKEVGRQIFYFKEL